MSIPFLQTKMSPHGNFASHQLKVKIVSESEWANPRSVASDSLEKHKTPIAKGNVVLHVPYTVVRLSEGEEHWAVSNYCGIVYPRDVEQI